MGTIADKLNLLLQTKEDSRAALIEKGQEVPANLPFSEYPDKIRAISGGCQELDGRDLVYGKDWIIADGLPYGANSIGRVNKLIYLDWTFIIASTKDITTTTDFKTYQRKNLILSDSSGFTVMETDGVNTIVAPKRGTRICYVSTDKGATWKTYNTAFSTGWVSSYSAYGNGKFLLMDVSSQVATSTNGSTWTSISNKSLGSIKGLTFVNGKFVAYTQQNYYTSTDGTTWTSHARPVFEDDEYIYAMAHVGNKLVLFGYTEIAYSEDLENWTVVNPNLGLFDDCYSSISGENIVVVFAEDHDDTHHSLYSTDGVNWNKISIPFSDKWIGTVAGNALYAISTSFTYYPVASSFNGKIITY